MDDSRLTLMTVHAHPDDEASKGACTVAKAHASGVHTVLVCCTGGEQGEILNPSLDRDEIRDRLPEVRMDELRASTQVIGYDDTVLLGYRDSGMADTPSNRDPRCFAQSPLEEAAGRLVATIRQHRPQVVVTYGDDQRGYPHPDHLRVHEVSVVAFEAAGDPDAFPEAGDPWQPLKLYYTVWSKARVLAMHTKFLELDVESPFTQEWLDRPSQDDRITTKVDISDFAHVRGDALRAHQTQVDPESSFWFGLPPEVDRLVHPYDDYVLARSLVDAELPEEDLFAGLRDRVGR